MFTSRVLEPWLANRFVQRYDWAEALQSVANAAKQREVLAGALEDSSLVQKSSKAEAMVSVLLLMKNDPFSYFLEPQEWAELALISKEVMLALDCEVFWLRFVGFMIRKPPKNFSFRRLFHFFAVRNISDVWKRQLLSEQETDRADNKVGGRRSGPLATFQVIPLQDRALKEIHISLSEETSRAFWEDNLLQSIGLKVMPTAEDEKTLHKKLKILQMKRWSIRDVAQTILSAPKRNKALVASSAAFLLRGMPKGRPLEKESVVALAALLEDVKTLTAFLVVYHCKSVEAIKEGKPPIKSNHSRPTRAVILYALAQMSWLRLMRVFAVRGLFKALFKAIHIRELLRRMVGKPESLLSAAEQRKVFLLQAMVRSERYPSSEELFVDWRDWVVKPLQELVAGDKLFYIPPSWLEQTWQASLAGKRLHPPQCRRLEVLLSVHGNTSTTWDMIFDLGLISPSQVLANLRSLFLLCYDSNRVVRFLTARLEQLDLLTVMKVGHILESTITPDFVSSVVAQLSHSRSEDGSEQAENATEEKVSLSMHFKDKTGGLREVEKIKNVGKSFSTGMVAPYMGVTKHLITEILKKSRSKEPLGRSAIVYTPELLNELRSGVPPQAPRYCTSSLWRNESICLNQLGPVELVEAGITWCQAEGDRMAVDLDLSIELLSAPDKSGVPSTLDTCSYRNVRLPGVTHSGDVVNAPYPEGAREKVEINLHKVLERYPTCTYIVIEVHCFSQQSFDKLHEASVYVANPHAVGSGPNGVDIMSAAKLTGTGTANIAGMITIERGDDSKPTGRFFFTCLDTSLKVAHQVAQSSAGLVQTKIMERLKAKGGLLYSKLASLSAALISKEVVLLHEGPTRTIYRKENESTWDFFIRVSAELDSVRPTLRPKYNESWFAEPLTVFMGELESMEELEQMSLGQTLNLVNVRATTLQVQEKGSLRYIQGWDVRSILLE